MLTNNKTYDNSNLRDHAKVFNSGHVEFHKAEERLLLETFATYDYCVESISYKTYLEASQHSRKAVIAIGIPAGGTPIEHGDIAILNGDTETPYYVDHVEYQDYARPVWFKVYLERSTIPYETV